jgi:hypothetical protein
MLAGVTFCSTILIRCFVNCIKFNLGRNLVVAFARNKKTVFVLIW